MDLALDPLFDRAAFDRAHTAWCKSKRWTEEEFRFCPRLAKWIADQGYKKLPPAAQNGTARQTGTSGLPPLVTVTDDAYGWMPPE